MKKTENFKCNWCSGKVFEIKKGTEKSIKEGTWIECENCSYTRDIKL